MTYLVRRLRKPDAWLEVKPESANLPDDAFPAPPLLDVIEPLGKKLSFWEVDNLVGKEADRLVAALVLSNKNVKEVPSELGLRFVLRSEVEAAGFEVERTHGDSMDRDFGRTHHCDIAVQDCGRAVKLAKVLAKGETRIFDRTRMIDLVAASIKAHGVDLKSNPADFVKQLFNAGKLSFSF